MGGGWQMRFLETGCLLKKDGTFLYTVAGCMIIFDVVCHLNLMGNKCLSLHFQTALSSTEV